MQYRRLALTILLNVLAPLWVYCGSPESDASASLGQYYFQNGNAQQAKYQLEEAVRLDPTEPKYQATLAEIELALGNTKEAIRRFENTIRLDSTQVDARSKLAQIYWSTGKDNDVLRVLDLRTAPGPIRSAWQFSRGLSLFRLGRLSEARRELQLLVSSAEFAAPANFFLGRIAYAQNQFQDALRYFAKAVERKRSEGAKAAGEYSYDYGLALFRVGKYAAASAQFALSTETYPLNPSPWMMRGRCEEELGNFAAAIDSYEESIRLEPSFERSYYHLARLHQRYGNRARAAELFEWIAKHESGGRSQ